MIGSFGTGEAQQSDEVVATEDGVTGTDKQQEGNNVGTIVDPKSLWAKH